MPAVPRQDCTKNLRRKCQSFNLDAIPHLHFTSIETSYYTQPMTRPLNMAPTTPPLQHSCRGQSTCRGATMDHGILPTNLTTFAQLSIEQKNSLLKESTSFLRSSRAVPMSRRPAAGLRKSATRLDLSTITLVLKAFQHSGRQDASDFQPTYCDLAKMHYPFEAKVLSLDYFKKYCAKQAAEEKAAREELRGDEEYVEDTSRDLEFYDYCQRAIDVMVYDGPHPVELRWLLFLKDVHDIIRVIIDRFPWSCELYNYNRHRALVLFCRMFGPHKRPNPMGETKCPPLDYYNDKMSTAKKFKVRALLMNMGKALCSPDFRTGHDAIAEIVSEYKWRIRRLPVSWNEFEDSGALAIGMLHYLCQFGLDELFQFLAWGPEDDGEKGNREGGDPQASQFQRVEYDGVEIKLHPDAKDGDATNWDPKLPVLEDHLFFLITSAKAQKNWRVEYKTPISAVVAMPIFPELVAEAPHGQKRSHDGGGEEEERRQRSGPMESLRYGAAQIYGGFAGRIWQRQI
jgi:hypothetical protein